MKKILFSILLTLLFVSTVYLPFSYAQDYRQMRLPDGAKARLGKGWISGGIAYSPDGTKLAAPSSIGIWIYDANTFAEVALLTGHTAHVNSVAFSPDSKKLVSGSQDKTVRLWNVETGELIHILQEHTNVVLSVAFSPDGNTIASGDDNRTIWVWDAHTNQMRYKRRRRLSYTYGSEVYSLAFSPDSKILASGVRNNTILLWDVSTGKLLHSTGGHEWGVKSVDFSSDGVTLASGDRDGHVRLWGARTGKFWQRIGGHGNGVNSVVFSPDGKILASGGNDSKIKLWDAFTGEYLRTLEGHANGVLGVTFSPNGRTIASASWTEIRFWDANTGQLLHTIAGHTRSVISVTFSPNGSTFASGHEDGTILLWDSGSTEHRHTLEAQMRTRYLVPYSAVDSVAFSPDGSTLASANWDDIELWDAHIWEHLHTLRGHVNSVYSVAFSPDGGTLASGGSGNIRLWNAATGEYKQTLRSSGSVRNVSFSPDGQMLVSASTDGGDIHLWHLRSGRRLRTLSDSNSYSVAFSPDGSTIVGGIGDEIWFWDPRSGVRLQKLTGHTDRHNIFSVVFSPDGKILASGSADKTIRLWDAITGTSKQTLVGHTDSVIGVSFSPDGRTLASGSLDGTILLWNLIPSDTRDATPSTPTTSDATVSISATPVQSPTIGELLTFPLNITDGENVAGYQATVEFDTTALRYVSSENGDYLPHGAFFVPPVVEENKVTLAASSLASESNGDGTLATLTFELVAAKTSTLKLSGVSLVDSDGVRSYPNIEENTQIEIIEAPYAPEDVNEDGIVNILDLVAIASNFGQTGENIADVNEDGVVDIVDLVLVAGALGSDAAAPSVWDRDLEVGLTHADVQQWLTQARGLDLTDVAQKGIIFLEHLLAALTPKETALLPNYPNPFNPETWIPYQLAEPADVSISIYSADGKLIRTLDLGHQPIGIYESRSRAAYWDGKNAIGEPVASGVYFYTLTARDFIATRKMLIMK